MPRTARVDYPGAIHHVTLRGIERRAIFQDDDDRRRFLQRAEQALVRPGVLCHGWALMPNHVHLVLQTESGCLSEVLRRLGTAYAMDFNRRHDRVGHLFQNRFHSRLVEDDVYLLTAVRYVHLNPVRAGIVPDLDALEGYPWTGHRVLSGRGTCAFQATGPVLRGLDEAPRIARGMLRRWMETGLLQEAALEAAAGGAGVRGTDGADHLPAAWGSASFQSRVMAEATRGERWIRANRHRTDGWTLDLLLERVCGELGVPVAEVRCGQRTGPVAHARAVIAWLARDRLDLPQSVIAAAVGVGGSSIARSIERGRLAAAGCGLERLLEDRPDPAAATPECSPPAGGGNAGGGEAGPDLSQKAEVGEGD